MKNLRVACIVKRRCLAGSDGGGRVLQVDLFRVVRDGKKNNTERDAMELVRILAVARRCFAFQSKTTGFII